MKTSPATREMELVEVTETAPSQRRVRTAGGLTTHREWCIAEIARMRSAGVDAGLQEYGQPGRLVCCVVRSQQDNAGNSERR